MTRLNRSVHAKWTSTTQTHEAIGIRMADVKDASALCKLWSNVYPRLQRLYPFLYDVDVYRQRLKGADFSHVVADCSGSIVGAMIVRWLDRNREAELFLVGVLPEWRGERLSILKRLYDAAVGVITARRVEYIFAMVRISNTVPRRFLIHQGFREVGIMEGRELVILPNGFPARESYAYYERVLSDRIITEKPVG
jgi:ribosomal protein S18 acetylase RimI-like enzyme